MCLKRVKRRLKPAGRMNLANYVAEILNNAEEHAGLVDWTIQGYLDTSLVVPICEIALFNFGRSFADTFRDLPRDSYTWTQIGRYIEIHRTARLFRRNWQEEDLLTVVALQPHVSSKNTIETDTRGHGTVELIDFFQRVHQECTKQNAGAEMGIVSGSTYIRFDGRYKLQDGGEGRRVIAFNADNSLMQQPDPKYVRSLGQVRFPDTIISIRFPLTAQSTLGGAINE